jgi:alkylation response protein AidB-like acyl-CoA dehydrogenase
LFVKKNDEDPMTVAGTQETFAADAMLDPEHIQYRDSCRQFMVEKLMEYGVRGEREGQFPPQTYDLLRQHGFLAPNYPEEIGGGGGDLLTGCIYYEEMTRVPAGISGGVIAHQHLAVRPILELGTEAQKSEYALPAIRAEKIGAFALTEPDAGSDVQGIRTFAKQEGDGWIVSGEKVYITNGNFCDYYVLAARTERERRPDALSLFLVDRKTKGIKSQLLNKLGNWSSSTALVSFDDVRVGKHQLLGRVGGGLTQLKATLSSGRILQATRGLGIAQVAYEKTLAYAQLRKTFGRTIGEYQGVSFKIAEMLGKIEAARLMIYSAARAHMAGQDANRLASLGKILAAEAVEYAAVQAVMLHGGFGYMEESTIPRLYRDMPESIIGEGAREIQMRIVARSLGMKC